MASFLKGFVGGFAKGANRQFRADRKHKADMEIEKLRAQNRLDVEALSLKKSAAATAAKGKHEANKLYQGAHQTISPGITAQLKKMGYDDPRISGTGNSEPDNSEMWMSHYQSILSNPKAKRDFVDFLDANPEEKQRFYATGRTKIGPYFDPKIRFGPKGNKIANVRRLSLAAEAAQVQELLYKDNDIRSYGSRILANQMSKDDFIGDDYTLNISDNPEGGKDMSAISANTSAIHQNQIFTQTGGTPGRVSPALKGVIPTLRKLHAAELTGATPRGLEAVKIGVFNKLNDVAQDYTSEESPMGWEQQVINVLTAGHASAYRQGDGRENTRLQYSTDDPVFNDLKKASVTAAISGDTSIKLVSSLKNTAQEINRLSPIASGGITGIVSRYLLSAEAELALIRGVTSVSDKYGGMSQITDVLENRIEDGSTAWKAHFDNARMQQELLLRKASQEEEGSEDRALLELFAKQHAEETMLAYHLAVVLQGGKGGRTISDKDYDRAMEIVKGNFAGRLGNLDTTLSSLNSIDKTVKETWHIHKIRARSSDARNMRASESLYNQWFGTKPLDEYEKDDGEDIANEDKSARPGTTFKAPPKPEETAD